METRYPLLGTEELGLIDFPYVPTDLVGFADVGVAWSEGRPPTWELASESTGRIPVFGTDISIRANLLGYMLLEFTYVYPFQRPDKGWRFDFQISTGW